MRRAVFVLAVVLLTACGDTAARPRVTVLAASSLRDAFEAIAADFEAATPGVDVRIAFAGSQRLAAQVLDGAGADVFASADTRQMSVVEDAGAVAGTVVVFAANRLAVAVAPGNPLRIEDVADLAVDGPRVVLAADPVPLGQYTRKVLDAAGVTVSPVSLELDARSVLARVRRGEADAAIVFASDLVAAGDTVGSVPIPDDVNVAASYSIATLAGSDHPDLATAFVTWVRSERGQARLVEHGFGAAP